MGNVASSLATLLHLISKKSIAGRGIHLTHCLSAIFRRLYTCPLRSARPPLQPQPHKGEEEVGTERLRHGANHRIPPNTLAPVDFCPPGPGSPHRPQLPPQPPDPFRCAGQCHAGSAFNVNFLPLDIPERDLEGRETLETVLESTDEGVEADLGDPVASKVLCG